MAHKKKKKDRAARTCGKLIRADLRRLDKVKTALHKAYAKYDAIEQRLVQHFLSLAPEARRIELEDGQIAVLIDNFRDEGQDPRNWDYQLVRVKRYEIGRLKSKRSHVKHTNGF